MIHVLASLHIKPGRREEFLAIFKANVPNVLKEQGCIEYVPAVDIHSGMATQAEDANIVTVIEKWASLDDLYAHMQAPHMLAYGEKVKDMLEKVTLKILQSA